MSLIAPSVLIDGGEENSVGGVEDDAAIRQTFGDSKRGAKLWVLHTSALTDSLAGRRQKTEGNAILENQIGVGIVLVVERA